MSKRLVISSLWAMLALGSAVFAMQQKQPSMHGRIVDASNKPISGFKLIAHRAGTAEEFMTVTNENGEFNFAELPAGTYFLQNPGRACRESIFTDRNCRSQHKPGRESTDGSFGKD
jgi:hypothetical protein